MLWESLSSPAWPGWPHWPQQAAKLRPRFPRDSLRDAVLTHPTLTEGLIPLFSSPALEQNSTRAIATSVIKT